MSLQFNLTGFHDRKREENRKKQQRVNKDKANLSAPRRVVIANTNATLSTDAKNIELQFWEEDGLRIPLYKGGKKRPCASASASLRNKKVDELLQIVEYYAGVEKRREMEGGKRKKAYIADWIESKETLALGRNQHSKLPSNPQKAGTGNGIDTARAPKPAPAIPTVTTKKLTVSIPSTTEIRQVQKAQALEKNRPAITLFDETQSLHTNEVLPKNQGHDLQVCTPSIDSSTLNVSSTNTEKPGKRKHDNAHEPTLPQQTAKKQRIHDPTGEASETPLEMVNPTYKEDQPQEHTEPLQDPVMQRREKEEARSVITVMNAMEEKVLRLTRRRAFLNDVGLDPTQLKRSSVIVHGRNRDRVITVTTNANSGETIIYDTLMTPSRDKLDVQRTQLATPANLGEPPFLKPGRHGRHGDFDDDKDRLTGRGHQMVPEDEAEYHNYLQLRGEFFSMYPTYPRLADGTSVHPDLLKGWYDNEIWYQGFRGRYPGLAPAHLWDCGCEKLDDGNESEAE